MKTYRKTATIQAEQFDGSAEMIETYHIEYDGAYILPFRIETPEGWLGMKDGNNVILTLASGDKITMSNGEYESMITSGLDEMLGDMFPESLAK